MSPSLRLVLGCLLALAGVALLTVAVLGARSRLPRNRLAGVRTAATLRSEAAFRLAQRAAAAPLGAAAVVALAGGAALPAGEDGAAAWVLLALSVTGMLGLAGVAGKVGDRVAVRLVPVRPAAGLCGGSCAGCDLVAGCRDGASGPVAGAPADGSAAR